LGEFERRGENFSGGIAIFPGFIYNGAMEVVQMMYPFMQLDDQTEVVHSELRQDSTGDFVQVYFEKPVEGGFQSASCYLPQYRWENVEGFTQGDLERYREFLERTAPLIFSRLNYQMVEI
jgi:hypothetical protein